MAFDAFLTFTGGPVKIKGETQDSVYKNAFEISEFSFGAENTLNITSATGGAKRRQGHLQGVHGQEADGRLFLVGTAPPVPICPAFHSSAALAQLYLLQVGRLLRCHVERPGLPRVRLRHWSPPCRSSGPPATGDDVAWDRKRRLQRPWANGVRLLHKQDNDIRQARHHRQVVESAQDQHRGDHPEATSDDVKSAPGRAGGAMRHGLMCWRWKAGQAVIPRRRFRYCTASRAEAQRPVE